MDYPKASFSLKEFRQVADFRVFTFERISPDHTRSLLTVRADLTLARTHRIPIQELPLLCKSLLDQLGAVGDNRTALVFNEADMRRYADSIAERAEAARQRRPARRPRTDNLGAAWRNPQTRELVKGSETRE